jgi:hypothetical protein
MFYGLFSCAERHADAQILRIYADYFLFESIFIRVNRVYDKNSIITTSHTALRLRLARTGYQKGNSKHLTP